MITVDLTGLERSNRVAMITRFPPSESASAPGAQDLARRLTLRHGIPVEVIRLLLPGDVAGTGLPVVMDINSQWDRCPTLVASRANRCDVVLVQVDRHVPLSLVDGLLKNLEIPAVLAMGDVPLSETKETSYLARLAEQASVVVVPSEVSRRRLAAAVSDHVDIEVIPYGSPWSAKQPRRGARKRILTWGYLAPGAGAERIVNALAHLRDLDPQPMYRLVGITDQSWTRREGETYRSALIRQADNLGVRDQIELVPILHSRRGLEREITRSDVIGVVYDSLVRASSRILTEAVSTGRPVVATAFPGAVEMLSTGAGTTAAHDDDDAMAMAIRRYLTDDEEYHRAVRIATAMSASLSLDEAARRYALLLDRSRLSRRPQTIPVT